MCHVSHVTCHMSNVIIIIFFFGQSGEAYWWSVCYQRGLPRLVLVFSNLNLYHLEQTACHMINEVKQGWAPKIVGWNNAIYRQQTAASRRTEQSSLYFFFK